MTICCVMATPERIASGECLHIIPEKRIRRGSHFCTNECHRAYRKLRRNLRAQTACRLCGRTMRRKSDWPTPSPEATEAQPEPVRSEHSAPHSPCELAVEERN